MDHDGIRALVALMEECGLAELELGEGPGRVRLVRAGAGPAAAAAEPPARRAPGAEQGRAVRAPMAGTFYAAPEPGAEPFVEVGAAVSGGAVLCIIESMKMMNEIKADAGGEILDVCVANGQPVNAGDVLFRIG
ncbi:MAG: acetyl-CoA carboxylase biotin carboxyl carrier protein subunit [Gammaproteobacteria bacterium]|nr:acetyl-CoA carboxylase biotin carboxyl carrier protein subunit [Gammaproteobacteria bacterium]